MAITSTQARIQYTQTTVPQTFSVPFQFMAAADLAVIKTISGVDTTLVLNTDYTVTGGSDSTGTVTILAGAATNVITIYRNADLVQPTEYTPNDSLPTETTEQTFDRLVMYTQQLEEQIKRCARMPVTTAELSPGAISITPSTTTLQANSIAALKAVSWTSVADKTNIVLSGYYAPGDGGGGSLYVDKADTTTADDGIGVFVASDGTRIKRIKQPSISLLASGADPTAAVDCRNQLQRALNYCRNNKVKLIISGDFRICSSKPLWIAGVDIEGVNGRIFNSLPDDYSWSVYSADSYSTSNVVDSTGATVSWNSASLSLPGGRPWNGKTWMFDGGYLGGSIKNLYIDGGWWATNSSAPAAYPTAKSIRGVKNDSDEMTYYYMFLNMDGGSFDGCTFANSPGATIELANSLKVHNCRFSDYGDHLLYTTGGSVAIDFTTNTILATRAASGTIGQRDYIFQTSRDALKLRGTSRVNVIGNIVTIPANTVFALITTASNQPGHCDAVLVASNIVNGGVLFRIECGRLPGTGDGSGYIVKNTSIIDNFNTTSGSYFAQFFNCAVQEVYVKGNVFTSASDGLISFQPSAEYANPINGLYFQNNTFKVASGPIVTCYGPLWGAGKLVFEGNRYDATNFLSSNCLLSNGTYQCGTCEFDNVVFDKNSGRNMFSLWNIATDEMDWTATRDYTGFSYAYPDGTLTRGDVVLYSGSYYVCKLTIAGNVANTNPSVDTTHWAAYTRQTVKVEFLANTDVVSTETDYVSYWTRQHIGFIASMWSGGNETINLNGKAPAYLLVSGANLDTITNSFKHCVIPGITTVAGLPAASVGYKGTKLFVTDANATLAAGIGNTVAAGGANFVPVYCDGSNWKIG